MLKKMLIAKVLLPIALILAVVVVVIVAIFGGSGSSSSEEGYTEISETYGDTIQERVWWALKDCGCGFSDCQIAAVMGNIEMESGYDVTMTSGDRRNRSNAMD